MPNRAPQQIQNFLDQKLYRFDLPSQYLGDEPNSHRKDWDSASARWCIMASWPYEAAAGNQSVPAVYKAVNIGREDFLCDRFYLPATPRDLRMFEKAGMPIFGIESKHQLMDFDVVCTSIAYPILTQSFVKMLSMSDIPVRWREREAKGLENFPMVMVGGQAYGAPEVLAPIIDCFWLGEVEEEPGNPGIATVTARIAEFKEVGLWGTDRLACYEALAREFNFLYFPRFVDVQYGYEDRSRVGVGIPSKEDLEQGEPEVTLSKQVISYTANLEGMRLPFLKRIVKDMDQVVPLDDQPLLYADPGMGSGDLEVGRGAISASDYVLVAGQGLRQFASWQGDALHPHDGDLGAMKCDVAGQLSDVSHVITSGHREVVQVSTVGGHGFTCTPDHEISVVRGPAIDARPRAGGYVPPEDRPERHFLFSHKRHGTPSRLEALAQQPRQWVRADQLVPGEDYLPVYYGQNVWSSQEQVLDSDISRESGSLSEEIDLPSVLDEDVAWLLGMIAGDVSINSNGDVASTSSVYLRLQAEDPGVAARAMQVLLRLFGRDIEPWIRNPQHPDRQTFEIRSTQLMRWLARNFGITDNENRRQVPELVLRSPRHVVAAYLSGLYDSDGSYDDRTGRPLFYSSSRELIRVVSLLMLNLGAPCSWYVTEEKREGEAGTASARRVLGREMWRVQGQQALDGDWSWLNPSHARRLAHVRRWREQFANRKGREAWNGVIYTPITAVSAAGMTDCYDMAVPEFTSFTCNGALVHNCPAWCSFCALTFRQKPFRQRSVGYMVEMAKKTQRNLGGTRLTPFMPDFPMHTQRKALIASLLEQVSDEVDAPAMRVDDFIADGDFIVLQVYGGMDGVTLGLEGNSQRMRDLVGKGTADADVKEAVAKGIRAGIRKFKLFMISNMPGEDEGDIFRILRLAKDLADIRDNMNQPHVRIQFSWTPLLIEANTPFQWFPIPAQSRALGDVWEEFRDLKIDFKLGGKSEPNKAAFFQLCQRASREVGEALVDTMVAAGTATWGGLPKNTKDLLARNLRKWGFHNDFADCFDERFKDDLFGWEFVDQGVSPELLWVTYQQMREFVEETDSHTYDLNFSDDYHGNEWIERCDTRCMGKSCGCCDFEDLKIRTGYIRAALHERDIDLASIVPVDQRSQAFKLRIKIDKAERYRLVQNDHWRFNVRRAAYFAQEQLGLAQGITKRSIRFASDTIRYKDWTCGTDYLEFGMTRRISEQDIQAFLDAMNDHLCATPGDESTRWLRLAEWAIHPGSSTNMRTDVDLSLFDLELDADSSSVLGKLRDWHRAEYVPMTLRTVDSYFAPGNEEVNAKDYVDDLWLVRKGSSLVLRMLIRDRPSPFNVYAALMQRKSWLDAAANPAVRIDAFVEVEKHQGDFFRPNCVDCGFQIPVNILDKPYDWDRCPRCKDGHEGTLIQEITYV